MFIFKITITFKQFPMKRILTICSVATLLIACNNTAKETPATETKDTIAASAPAPAIELPYKAKYSSDWSIGDPKYTKIVLDFYKNLETGNIEGFKDHFEDSIQFKAYDGRLVKKPLDEFVKKVNDFRARYKFLSEEFLAFVSLHSNDKNEDWVALWINERAIGQNGKADSTVYQENWRFRNGKVYSLGDYARYEFHR
jgi:hypothetical protein